MRSGVASCAQNCGVGTWPGTRIEPHEKRPVGRATSALALGELQSAPRPLRGPIGTSAMSPIWRGVCQGVGVDTHCLVGGGGGRMWLRLAGRSGRPRVRDVGHAHIRGLGTPRPWFVARPLSKVERARPGAGAQATNRGVVCASRDRSGRLASGNGLWGFQRELVSLLRVVGVGVGAGAVVGQVAISQQ